MLTHGSVCVGHGFLMKIGDFGMSRHVALARRQDGTAGLLRQLSTSVIGTACYAAPELLEGVGVDESVDMTAAHVDTILKSDVYRQGPARLDHENACMLAAAAFESVWCAAASG